MRGAVVTTPAPTAEQTLTVAAMIRGGHADDTIAAHVRITREQVAHLRGIGLGCKLKRKGKKR